MEILANLAGGLAEATTPTALLFCFIGVFLGTLVGALPGIGSSATIALLLPITYYMGPTDAIIMLAGVYYGSEYGGSITSILLNIPGGAASAITCLDGNALAKKGKAGVALFITAVASFVGGTCGIVLVALFAPVLAAFAMSFAPADYFAVMVLGLIASCTIASGSPLKGLTMVVLGVLFGCVGMDANSGELRLTFGSLDLFDGIGLVPLAMGLFGLGEIITALSNEEHQNIRQKITLSSMLPNRSETLRSIAPTARGSLLGSLLGALPGAGPTIASFLAYGLEKRISKNASQFGTGMVEGVVAPESANNAAAQTAFIPTLSLAIPGSASMALMLGALMIHGISPGPLMVERHPDVFWGLIASFWIGNILLLVLNIPLIGMWVQILNISPKKLYPAVICLMCIGAYSVSLSVFDVSMMLAFGFLGYFMQKAGFSPAPLLMGFILGPLMEEYFRRAMILSDGNLIVFVERPISLIVLFAVPLLILWPMIGRRLQPQ